MPSQIVWTKQHTTVWESLQKNGRYVAKRRFVVRDLQEQAGLVMECYDWLVQHHPLATQKPADADYPVWVSFTGEATMLPSPDTVILELEIPTELIAPIHIAKWGAILNYSYLPTDENDEKRHMNLLQNYRVSDAQAYMSRFYPQIKREIQDSWKRLFDPTIDFHNNAAYGTVWELKYTWIRNVVAYDYTVHKTPQS